MLTIPQDLDLDRLRAAFPSLQGGTAYFDSPGGTQTPIPVADAIRDALIAPLANRGALTAAARNADDIVEACRAAFGDFLHVQADTVVFGRSSTALTFDFSRALARTWRPGDEVVVTRLDHNANVEPWVIAAERAGATVRTADFDPATGELPVGAVVEQLSDRTRLVAVTAASNLIGTMPDVRDIADAAHRVGALVFVDGVHYAAHALVDVPALGADLFTCSPYKFMGPHCGVLTARRDLLEDLVPDRLATSADVVPERFELGTLPYELMAGATAAVDFLAAAVPGDGTRRDRLATSVEAFDRHETALRQRIEEGLQNFPRLTLHSRAARRSPTLFVSLDDRREHALSEFLAQRDINAPSGHFYARDASRHLGLGDAGALRIGLAPYSSAADADRLLAAIGDHLDGDGGPAGAAR
ncbi:cysteine desulfurase-like protein [Amnibacterium sp. CER49]|uniref:cysteine desulfurase-like protein n=1 Tax=Amnibacterium sp. CER49 TaxID=3039161 RepID=UPI0024496035|nr:cysteine desulfurase-like protein [Amnibacterium sp. CER49]MDH2444830.1 cysteine desulfurase-like protein [Amnibacterium sp. CER49]